VIKGRIQCVASETMVRLTASAVSTMRFATSFATDPVTTSTSQPPTAAVDFSVTPVLRCVSGRPHDPQNPTCAPHRKWGEM
jgi:hypothetical protein